MNRILQTLAIALAIITSPQAMEESSKDQQSSVTVSAFDPLPTDVKGTIFQTAIEPYVESCLQKKMSYTDFLKKVTLWKFRLFNDSLTKDDYNTLQAIYCSAFSKVYEVYGYEYKDCLTFLKGKVIVLKDVPDKEVIFRFAELLDPFRGEFDLSTCIHPQYGKMDQYIRLLSGYPKKNEDIGKTEIRFVPLFRIKKELQTGNASYLKDIYIDVDGKWRDNAQFGIYMAWRIDNLNSFAYVTTENCASLSSKSLGDHFLYKTDGGWYNFNENVRVIPSIAPPSHMVPWSILF